MTFEIVTSDLSQFGQRELRMAGELLMLINTAKDNTRLDEGVKVFMNRNSGNVFLCDEDYNVAMIHDGKLEDFHSCPNCGNEAIAPYFRAESLGSKCCQEYADDLGLDQDEVA